MLYNSEILDDVRLLLGNTDVEPGDFSNLIIYRAFSQAVKFSSLYVSHGITVVNVSDAGVELSNTDPLSTNFWLLFIWGAVMLLLEGWGLANQGVRWRSGLATIDNTKQSNITLERVNDAARNFWGIIALLSTYGYDVDLYSLNNDTLRLKYN